MTDTASFNNLPFESIIFYCIKLLYIDVYFFFTAKLFICCSMDERTAFSLVNWNKIPSVPFLVFGPDRTLDGVSLPFLLQDKLFSIQFNK